MSLDENAGRQDAEPKNDSLLPLDFKDASAQKRKPLPLGQFMKKAEQKPIIEPTPVQTEADVQPAAPQASPASLSSAPQRAPIPLVARKPETQAVPAPSESKEEIKPVEEAVATPEPPKAAPVPATPARPPQAAAATAPEPKPGSAAKPIPLSAKPKPLTPAAPAAQASTASAPKPLKPVSGPRTFSEKEHAEMKQQAKAAEAKRKPLKPSVKPVSGHIGGRLQESSLGGMLLAARNRAGLSIPQVEEMTRIKKSYLEALESDDIDNLPPRVFISAYVRNLSAIYGVSPEDLEVVNEKLKEMGTKNEVPEALIQNLEKDGQVNMAEEARVRKMLIGAVALVILVALWVSGVYIGLKIKHSRDLASAEAVVEAGAALSPATSQAGAAPAPLKPTPLASSPGFDASVLERFVFQENPTMSELRLPNASAASPEARRR